MSERRQGWFAGRHRQLGHNRDPGAPLVVAAEKGGQFLPNLAKNRPKLSFKSQTEYAALDRGNLWGTSPPDMPGMMPQGVKLLVPNVAEESH